MRSATNWQSCVASVPVAPSSPRSIATLDLALPGLAADWREAHRDVEPASKLLELIDRERKRQTAGSIDIREAVQAHDGELPKLPDGWVWTCGARLFSWSSGKFLPKSKRREGPVPVYGGNGITGYHDKELVNRQTLVVGRVDALCGNVYVTAKKAWVTDNAIYASFVPSRSLRQGFD